MSNGEQINSWATCKHFLQVGSGEHRNIVELKKIAESSKSLKERSQQ
jgi:hypothetical protein